MADNQENLISNLICWFLNTKKNLYVHKTKKKYLKYWWVIECILQGNLLILWWCALYFNNRFFSNIKNNKFFMCTLIQILDLSNCKHNFFTIESFLLTF